MSKSLQAANYYINWNDRLQEEGVSSEIEADENCIRSIFEIVLDFQDEVCYTEEKQSIWSKQMMIKILFICHGSILKNPGKAHKINDYTAQ